MAKLTSILAMSMKMVMPLDMEASDSMNLAKSLMGEIEDIKRIG